MGDPAILDQQVSASLAVPAPLIVRRRGRPPSDKSAKKSTPIVPRQTRQTTTAATAPPLMAIQRRQRALDEADEHHDLRAKGNDGSPVKRTREPSNDPQSTAPVLVNTSGIARAAEHAAKPVEDVRTATNNPLPRIIGFADRARGDSGLFRLPHNRRDEDPFQGPGIVTSSIQGHDSDPDYNEW